MAVWSYLLMRKEREQLTKKKKKKKPLEKASHKKDIFLKKQIIQLSHTRPEQ
jgi:hypothetical protein